MIKNTILICIATVFCINLSFAQKNLYTEEINLDSFEELNVEGVFNVYLQHSTEESLLIETSKDNHDLIIVDVHSGILDISMKNNRKYKLKKINLYINYKSLHTIDLDIVGNLVSKDDLAGDQIELILDGVGNTELNLDCNALDAEFKRIGNIEISGRANDVRIDSKCTGNLRCRDLMANNLKLSSSQVGNIDVYAEETLDIRSSGVGNVSYSGNAKIINLDSSGIGKVKKL